MLESYIKWIEAHERLLLVAVAGLALWCSIGKIDTLIVHHDQAQLSQAQVVAAVQQEKNAALAKQVADDKASFDTLNAQVQARDAQLVQLQAQLVATLAQQQKMDRSMPPTVLAQRWATLVPPTEEGAFSFTADGNHITVTEGEAVATVQQLEIIPVQQQEIKNAQEELDNAHKLVTAGATRVTDLTAQVTGLQVKSVEDAKVCSDQIKVVKSEARKSKLKWFGAGFVTGLTLGIWKF